MSWGTAASTTGNAGGAAASSMPSLASGAAGAAGQATSSANLMGLGNAAGAAGTGAGTGASGFSAGLTPTSINGPTVANAADLASGASNVNNAHLAGSLSNTNAYGTPNPGAVDKVVSGLERFSKGQNQNLSQTWQNFGNNPETYGAAYGALSKIASMGKPSGSGAAPITINSSYQEPENEYLKKYRRA